jgi:hypothetical protein
VPPGGTFLTAGFDNARDGSRSRASIRPVPVAGSKTGTADGWSGGSAGSGRACRAGKVRPPSRLTRTCGVPAIEGVTACQAASAAARERPGVIHGVSHGGNADLTVRPPVIVATVAGFLLCTGWLRLEVEGFQFGPRVGWEPVTRNGRAVWGCRVWPA